MIFWGFRAILSLPIVALVLAVPAHLGAAPQTDRDVQALANFPALQRLGHGKSSAVRGYLGRVADAYRQVGYRPLASAIEDSAPLIRFFAEPKSGRPLDAKRARTIVRQLKAAVARTHRVVLPQRVGEKIPNYYGLALAFLKNSRQALKNVAADRTVNLGLRKSSGTSWVTKINEDHVTLGGTLLSGGTLGLGDFNLDVAGCVTVTNGGTVHLSFNDLKIEIPEGRWIAFPPDLEIPDGTDLSTLILLNRNYRDNGIELSTGTRLVKVSADYVAPADTTEITGPVTLLWNGFLAIGDDSTLFSGFGTELILDGWAVPSPTPPQE